jgi:hypothetical protein
MDHLTMFVTVEHFTEIIVRTVFIGFLYATADGVYIPGGCKADHGTVGSRNGR